MGLEQLLADLGIGPTPTPNEPMITASPRLPKQAKQLTPWQHGELEGEKAARYAPSGTRLEDIEFSASEDFIEGFKVGWETNAVPVYVLTPAGPQIVAWEAR